MSAWEGTTAPSSSSATKATEPPVAGSLELTDRGALDRRQVQGELDRRPDRSRRLNGDPALGLYGPDSEAWRLNREARLLLAAGPRALLLQLAHPLVAEGVSQHSDFRADPWGRLTGTLTSYLRIVYGDTKAARRELRRLNRLHRSVQGPVVDPTAQSLAGMTYQARDPRLSLWVHFTLIDSTMAAYDAWIEPLGVARRAAFYAETVPIGLAFGIPASILPADYRAFEAYGRDMLRTDGPIQVTDTARSLVPTILHPPLGPLPPPLYDWVLWPGLALLPDRIRAAYGIPAGAGRAAVGTWLSEGFRFWGHVLPGPLRWMPQARAADRRVRYAKIVRP
jgi:uncharacterized protein (DUF2236 family)